ncbi:tRNA uridine-5-carboxymethylaminomethyl(34) synthesis enzyme MnmG [Spiroplasma endosymbiont of Amphibalanus improvisus]|uniref:tRNA uridine-5-carboxymethylaminomethyl(34) synthesis enzyme MnmG n=1 Tax=Spiroplasma endosymbiont of Amphibalanus improvisus TaxID=3066327 RepID=UPI00313CCD48
MEYDLIVVGAGHAGVEAILIAEKFNLKVLLITGDFDKIASMPCNPSIGGPAKGIVVREIDALGGVMGRVADATALQVKMLNSSRGPAVQSLRIQSDKIEYSKMMKKIIFDNKKINKVEGIVEKLIIKNNECQGVQLNNKIKYFSKKVILTLGTYMSSLTFQGSSKKSEGPDGAKTSSGISEQFKDIGLEMFRLKTGTPPRILKSSINFKKAKEELGDDKKLSFSYMTEKFIPINQQVSCWLIHSNNKTHKVVSDNLNKSGIYNKTFEGIGPRYCPSFEDKIVRFSEMPRHQIFLEPESKHLETIYLQGFSTSMPKDIQEKMVRSLPGLEDAQFSKYAYAIEYEAINPLQMNHDLSSKKIKNLYTAGQINGTSGYEEAACQGLIAGINACLSIKKQPPLILGRDEAYIGVLIDDLVLKGTDEPYRLLTSRAEYRLLLRNDNAEDRLKKYAIKYKLISKEEIEKFNNQIILEKQLFDFLKKTKVNLNSEFFEKINKTHNFKLKEGTTLFNLLKRPDFNSDLINDYFDFYKNIDFRIKNHVLIEIKFEGYINKEKENALKNKKLEKNIIPKNLDYNLVDSMASEAKEKLNKIQPKTVGMASRISGINPSDIQMLLFYLRKINKLR